MVTSQLKVGRHRAKWEDDEVDHDQPNYLAYLLRLWAVEQDGDRIWRASLESSHTGERHGFADLTMLFGYLSDLTSARPKPFEATTSQDSHDR